MRLFPAIGVVALWAALCGVAWLAVKDRPLLPAHDPAPALGANTPVYLDRDYRLDTVPRFLDGAAIVRTFRHGADPIHVRLEGPGVLWLLAPEGDVPASWGDLEAAAEAVLCRGAQLDLTRAYRRSLPAGDHVLSPLGPRNVASPILVVASGDVREIETPAGLWRRMELATRGFPRRPAAALLALLGAIGVGLGLLTAARRGRKTNSGNGLHRPDA